MTDNLPFSPAAERNAGPILAVLQRVLPPQGLMLELACGAGQHAAAFSAALPAWTWQPSDADPAAARVTTTRCKRAGLANALSAMVVDVTAEPWPFEQADAVLVVNLLHISPWAATAAVMRQAARLLPPGAPLVVYGPFDRDGRHTGPGNASFHQSLRAREPAWGLRDIADVEAEAVRAGLLLDEMVAMPADNLTLVFRR